MKTILPCAAILAVLSMSPFAHAATSAGKKIDHAAHDVAKATKKTARAIEDKTCHLVHGKIECLKQKIKHKAENAADDVKAE